MRERRGRLHDYRLQRSVRPVAELRNFAPVHNPRRLHAGGYHPSVDLRRFAPVRRDPPVGPAVARRRRWPRRRAPRINHQPNSHRFFPGPVTQLRMSGLFASNCMYVYCVVPTVSTIAVGVSITGLRIIVLLSA
ncbi:phylloplanin [Iris pallida]|uniref:Phylloplanin n=1 Tax=Iris pallida TaxID=29817 RepID=A0AAX6GTC6_IRIPA|nr:phylloplanin [Iris pallida]